MTSRLGQEWFGDIRGDVLSGLVVALALIPEAIAFSVIAGVDPKVGVLQVIIGALKLDSLMRFASRVRF
ncbi:Sulfate permease family protein [Luteibacter sp. 329MFSha]|nr:MFS superfamily sulfate permease-like transporter [Luteibacter sp. 3190]SEV97618.1 Sulfate permease family protein [Luteibacter sp. 329MFSha]